MTPATIDVWAPLPPSAHLGSPAEAPFPLRESGCTLFSKARHGLWHGAKALGLAEGDEVLVSAFNHGSEIEALERAGARCRFFEASPALRDDPEAVADLVGPATKAVHLIHYLGFPQDAARWRRFCDERGLLLFEDAAQAWLAHHDGVPVGSHGDLAVFCLYKTLGLPDGAVLLMDEALDRSDASRGRPTALARRHAAWVAAMLPTAARPPGPYDPERDFALGDPDTPISAGTAALVPKLVAPGIAARRRGNYRMLRDLLPADVEAVLDEPPEGSSPLVLPILAEDKEDSLERLRAAGVHGLNLWSARHPSIEAGSFPEAQRLRDRVVGLPVHQRLGVTELRRVARGLVGAPRREDCVIGDVEDIDAIADDWDRLAERAGSVFASHLWARAWWEHFGAGEERLRVKAVYGSDGALRAVLPLYAWRERPLVLRFLGHDLGSDIAPVCAPEDRAVAARALRATARRQRASMVVADGLLADADWLGLLGARSVHHSPSPIVAINGTTWEEFLARRSSNFRQQVRRRERKLAKSHELDYRLTERREELDADFETLLGLHHERWGDNSEVYDGPREPFHRAVVRRAFDKGWLRMWTMTLDGEPAASWYGFRLGDVESYYQAGRADRHENLAVGFVMLAHTIREAMADGVRLYRLGPGGSDYKYRFATADEGVHFALMGLDPLGRAGAAAATGVKRAEPLRLAGRRMVGDA